MAGKKDKPEIKIPDLQLEIREFFKEFGDKVKDLQKAVGAFSSLVVGVLTLGFIVLVFSLATILMQAWQFAATYQDEAHQLSIEKDAIQNTVDQQKIIIQSQKDMQKELDSIKASLGK